ncbi:unnamed protein product [Sympodiomycopsis kandeliae]
MEYSATASSDFASALARTRSHSIDSWCTTASTSCFVTNDLQDTSTSAIQQRSDRDTFLFSSHIPSRESSSTFFDAEEYLHDTTETSNIYGDRRPPRNKLEPAKPRRSSSLKKRYQAGSLVFPPGPVEGDTSMTAASTRPSVQLTAANPRLVAASSSKPPQSLDLQPRPALPATQDAINSAETAHEETDGLWGSGWNDLSRWSPSVVSNQRIEERNSADTYESDEQDECPSPMSTFSMSLPPRRHIFEPQSYPVHEEEEEEVVAFQENPVSSRNRKGFRALLRETKSAMNFRPLFQSQAKKEKARPPVSTLDASENQPPLRTKRSAAGRALNKFFPVTRGEYANEVSVTPSDENEFDTDLLAPYGRDRMFEQNSRRLSIHSRLSSPPASPVLSRRPIDGPRRRSSGVLSPQSILTSASADVQPRASYSTLSNGPAPASPITSRHVSFELSRNTRPLMNPADASVHRRSCHLGSGRLPMMPLSSSLSTSPHWEVMKGGNIYLETLNDSGSRNRCLSERSSMSMDGRRSISSLNSSGFSLGGGLRTPQSGSCAILSTGNILAEGPKQTNRSFANLDLERDLSRTSLGDQMKEVVQRATGRQSSLSFHAEQLECESLQGEAMVAVKRKKSVSWIPVERQSARSRLTGARAEVATVP